jgi:Uma2 family endonuclease
MAMSTTRNASQHAQPDPADRCATFFWDSLSFSLPVTACTLEGFITWAISEDYPQRGRFSFINREIVIDLSPEEIEGHAKVRTAVSGVISSLNEELDLGEFFTAGVLVTSVPAEWATEPDGTLIKWRSFQTKRVRLVPCKDAPGEYKEIRGRPDWVLEVVSCASIRKDTILLREAYHRAGIPEYWLVSALGKRIDFQILVRRRKDYQAVRPQDGWFFSPVFGRFFRLERQRNRMGWWRYKLHVK